MLEGTEQFLENLRNWAERKQAAAIRAMEDAGDQIMAEARFLCPVDTTNLQNSGTVQPAVFEGGAGGSIVVRLGFNGTAIGKDGSVFNYGIYVHEHTGLTFSTLRNPHAQSKFLSIPLLKWRYKLLPFLVEEVRVA